MYKGWAMQKGFTIVELLIVIVVIGILAAVTIVAFNGVQNRANDTAVQSDLSNMAKQVQAYHAIEGRYPTQAQFFNSTGGMKIAITKSSYDTTAWNLYYCTDRDTGERYGIAARSKSRTTYVVSSTNGVRRVTTNPSWQTACGAFGESILENIQFNYGYNVTTDIWIGVLAN